ncbi:hypothetical protein BUALT_Bualt19G0064600 [Buddleja alternifolia]|uniref:F-box associated beta-propeller type 1 domain-containing protein n=1 Tax=Buddleja alternifolia TaxID=168488 RepID=A0AAV6W2B4_9LAMI|nr:hypothetical protein BUALT_Bualt19G0064600 [Buddleja alternifolia]
MRKSRKLPDMLDAESKPEFKVYVEKYGFGFAESDDDYKVLGVLRVNRGIVTHEPIAKLYSLKSNSWKRIEYHEMCVTLDNSGTFVNGKLYWGRRPFTRHYGFDKDFFDLDNEVYGKTEHPYPRGAFACLDLIASDCIHKDMFAKLWYMVFKKITSYFGVGWDRDTNTVLVPPDLWVKWLKLISTKENHHGMLLRPYLQKKTERRVPVNDEVIEISSDEDNPTGGHNGLRVDNANMVVAEDDEDEVVSPPQKIPIIEIDPPNVQLQPGDDGSTNMLSQRYFAGLKRSAKCLSISKVPPPRCLFGPPSTSKVQKMENSRPKLPSDLASSTASSSPTKAVKYTIY